ncbi:MAG: hypothetical protein WBL36_02040 [Bacilli bacterium]|nr:hypothetical protein [Bacilli bacterium]
MKRIIFLLTFMIIALCGCGNKLSAPENITFADEVLSWDAVKGAESYRLIIGSETYYTEEASYDLTFLGDGRYDVYICALKGEKASPYTDKFRIVIKRSLQANIHVDGEYLAWDKINSAKSYALYIDGVETATVDDEKVLLSDLDLDPNKIYVVQIRAIYEHNTSTLSDHYYHHTYATIEELSQAEVNLSDKKALEIDVSETDIKAILFDNESIEDYSLAEGTLEIPYSFFRNKKIGKYQCRIFADDILYQLQVTVTSGERPYIISDTAVSYQTGEDIVLLVELAGGSFAGLTGNNIGDGDYEFVEDRIIIYSSYVERIIEDNPDRKKIVLLYTLNQGKVNIIGDIIINLTKDEVNES